MTATEGPLLGAHSMVVEQLVKHLHDVKTGDAGRRNVVVLEAPSGYGKSRIIREFYNRIRTAGAADNGYWPPLIHEEEQQSTGVIVDPLPQRKVLGPNPDTFVWKSDALPDFGWWSFNCELIATGDSVGLDSEATDQLNAHSLALTISRNERRGMKGYGGAALAAIVDDVKAYAKSELEGAGLEAVQGLIGEVAGLGLWVQLGNGLIRSGRTAVTQRKKLLSEVDVGDDTVESRLTRARGLADVMTGLTWARLPAIVVIEDAHRMGKDLRAMLDALPVGDVNHPVMIVATVWPEGAENAEYKSWFEAAMKDDRGVRIEVPRLEQGALAELIRSYYPGKISARLALELAGRIESPYIAKLWLTTRSVRREIELSTDENDLTAVLQAETHFPANILQVYEQRWSELPDDVRSALALAAYATPEDEETAKYIPVVVDQASRQIRMAAASGLGQSVTPFAWSRAEGSLNIIRELLMTQVAQKYTVELLARRELTEFRDAVSAAAGVWLLSVRSPDLLHERAAQVVAAKLVLANPGGRTADEIMVARIVLAEVLLRSNDPAGAFHLLSPSVSRLHLEATEHDDEALAVYARAAEFVAPEQAALAAERRESLASEQSAPADRVLEVRVQAAWSRALVADIDAKQWPAVVTMYTSLLSDIVAELGEQNETYIEALHDYTQVLLAAGERVAAVAEYRTLLTVMNRVFGAESAATLDAKFEFVQYTGRDGSATEMIPLVRELAVELLQRYGRWDHRTIKTRLALAHWRLRTPRDREGLLPEIDDIIEAAAEASGQTHIDTLKSRAAHSICLSREGAVQRGIEEADELLRVAQVVFGVRGPEVPYFLRISRNARSYLNHTLPVLQTDAVPLATGDTRLPADAVSVARTLYPVFRGAVPEASPEAMRSKVLTDFLARNPNA